MLISVSSLILVLINVRNNFISVGCFYSVQDFNCGFQRVFSQSQYEFEPHVSEFVRDSANHVGAASMFAVVVDFNSVTNKQQKQLEPST